jgi:hypothetical protein
VSTKLQEAASGRVYTVVREALYDLLYGTKRVDVGAYPVQMRACQPTDIDSRTLPMVRSIQERSHLLYRKTEIARVTDKRQAAAVGLAIDESDLWPPVRL